MGGSTNCEKVSGQRSIDETHTVPTGHLPRPNCILRPQGHAAGDYNNNNTLGDYTSGLELGPLPPEPPPTPLTQKRVTLHLA